MAITGPSSFVWTSEQFISHWTLANDQLGVGNELVLKGNIALADLQSKLTALNVKRFELQSAITSREQLRGGLNSKRAALHEWLRRFNETVRADYGGTSWETSLPDLPSEIAGQGAYMRALDDTRSIWTQMNADPAITTPITLLGGYDLASFTADVTDLLAAFTAVHHAEKVEELSRLQRNRLQDDIYAVLKNYRQKLPTKFPTDDPLVATLPRLTPAGGSAPVAVSLSGAWMEDLAQARFNWTASTDASLDHYQLRMTPGPEYSEDDESVVGSFASGTVMTETDAGLTMPGQIASFRLYVVTTDGNEVGSNTVVVSRG
ncbi:MAG: hypothetical protein R3C99_00010 [Pirellulaceae bacterium]